MLLIILALIFIILFLFLTLSTKIMKINKLTLENKKLKDIEIEAIQESNELRLKELSIFMPENTYIKDENGNLSFFDKEFKEINISKNINIINSSDKSLDGKLYSYINLYKIGDKFNQLDELNNVPTSILGELSTNSIINSKVNIEPSLDGFTSPFTNESKFEHKESTSTNIVSYTKTKKELSDNLHDVLLRSPDFTEIKPSNFIHLNKTKKIKDIKLNIEEEFLNKIKKVAFDNTFIINLMTTLDPYESILKFSKSEHTQIINVNGKSFYVFNYTKSQDFNTLALSILFFDDDKRCQELLPYFEYEWDYKEQKLNIFLY